MGALVGTPRGIGVIALLAGGTPLLVRLLEVRFNGEDKEPQKGSSFSGAMSTL